MSPRMPFAPRAPHPAGSAGTIPAHASCESPPRINARLAFGTTARRNRSRSAAYPCQSSKFQLIPWRPTARSARADATGTARPPTPRAGPDAGPASPSQSDHARSASAHVGYPPGGFGASRRASSAAAPASRSGGAASMTMLACAYTCQRTPASRDSRVSRSIQRVCASPNIRFPSLERYASNSSRMASRRRSRALPRQSPGAGVADVDISIDAFAKTFPAGSAFGSVLATSRVSITTNDATSPKCTVRLYPTAGSFGSLTVGSRVGNHSWYARIAARTRSPYLPSRSV